MEIFTFLFGKISIFSNQTVRKAAARFLKAIVVRQLIPADQNVIDMARSACSDKLLSVRKNGISTFTSMMISISEFDQSCCLNNTMSENAKVDIRLSWLQMIMEKIHDQEKTVKEEAVRNGSKISNYFIKIRG